MFLFMPRLIVIYRNLAVASAPYDSVGSDIKPLRIWDYDFSWPSRAPLNGLLCLDSEGSSCFPCASKTGQTAMLDSQSSISTLASLVCRFVLHEGCSNFFRSPGRALISERLL